MSKAFTDLPTYTTPQPSDVLAIVDVTNNVSKEVAVSDVLKNGNLNTSAGELGGAWLAWTPTLANLTIGNGTVTARYYKIGKTIRGYLKIVFGSTTVMGTSPTASAPVTAASQYGAQRNPIGLGHIQVAGANNYVGGIEFNASVTVMALTSTNVAGAYANPNAISNSIPTTGWTTNDYVSYGFEFEAA